MGPYYAACGCQDWDLHAPPRAYVGPMGMGITWLQCVWVDPGTCEGWVQTAVTLLHVA